MKIPHNTVIYHYDSEGYCTLKVHKDIQVEWEDLLDSFLELEQSTER